MLSQAPWRAFAYVLTGLVLAFPTMLAMLLFPLLPHWSRSLSAVERRRVAILKQAVVADAPGIALEWSWSAARVWLLQPRTWRELANTVCVVVFAAVAAPVLLSSVTLIAAALASPVLQALGNPVQIGDTVASDPASITALVLLGVLLATIVGAVCLVLAAAQASLTRMLLGGAPTVMERQVDLLSGAQVNLVDAFEAERGRIERDLHDGSQQHLAGAIMLLGMGQEHIRDLEAGRTDDVAGLRTILDRAQGEVESSLDATRAAVAGLRPQTLVERGLVPALEELAVASSLPLRITSSLTGRVAPAVEASMYSVAKEFLTNSMKHGQATEAVIDLRIEGGEVALSLRDDGVGGADPRRGTGLLGMQQRASMAGGRMTVSSPVGGPTSVRILLPVDVMDGIGA
ncbi:sensor histidine kinase [Clavibacter michiganensis]|nr:histidine kinase [Clavibacter michiganensis]